MSRLLDVYIVEKVEKQINKVRLWQLHENTCMSQTYFVLLILQKLKKHIKPT